MQGPHQVAVKSTTTCVGRRTPRQSPPVTAKIRLVRLPVHSNARDHRFIEIALSRTYRMQRPPLPHARPRGRWLFAGGFSLDTRGVPSPPPPASTPPIHFPQIVRTGLSPLTSSSNPDLSSITCTSPPILLLHTHTHTRTGHRLPLLLSSLSVSLLSFSLSSPHLLLPLPDVWKTKRKKTYSSKKDYCIYLSNSKKDFLSF